MSFNRKQIALIGTRPSISYEDLFNLQGNLNIQDDLLNGKSWIAWLGFVCKFETFAMCARIEIYRCKEYPLSMAIRMSGIDAGVSFGKLPAKQGFGKQLYIEVCALDVMVCESVQSHKDLFTDFFGFSKPSVENEKIIYKPSQVMDDINQMMPPPNEVDYIIENKLATCWNETGYERQALKAARELSLSQLIRNVLESLDTYS